MCGWGVVEVCGWGVVGVLLRRVQVWGFLEGIEIGSLGGLCGWGVLQGCAGDGSE